MTDRAAEALVRVGAEWSRSMVSVGPCRRAFGPCALTTSPQAGQCGTRPPPR
jgi:hypothetical protein